MVVQKLLKPGVLKAKGAWGRELAILKKLQARHPADGFWTELDPAEKLDSLAWFLTPYGTGALAEEWKAYQFRMATEKSQAAADQERIDTLSSVSMMESTPDEASPMPEIAPKRDALAWADSV